MITECEWQQMKKHRRISSFLKTLKCVEPRKQLSFEKIFEGIKNDTLYKFLFVDIHTADELKSKFDDFPMIIKHAMISREDLSSYMFTLERPRCRNRHFLKLEEEFLQVSANVSFSKF